jgi:hypothetical protein
MRKQALATGIMASPWRAVPKGAWVQYSMKIDECRLSSQFMRADTMGFAGRDFGDTLPISGIA